MSQSADRKRYKEIRKIAGVDRDPASACARVRYLRHQRYRFAAVHGDYPEILIVPTRDAKWLVSKGYEALSCPLPTRRAKR